MVTIILPRISGVLDRDLTDFQPKQSYVDHYTISIQIDTPTGTISETTGYL